MALAPTRRSEKSVRLVRLMGGRDNILTQARKELDAKEDIFDSAMVSLDGYKKSDVFYIASRYWKLKLEPLRKVVVKFN